MHVLDEYINIEIGRHNHKQSWEGHFHHINKKNKGYERGFASNKSTESKEQNEEHNKVQVGILSSPRVSLGSMDVLIVHVKFQKWIITMKITHVDPKNINTSAKIFPMIS